MLITSAANNLNKAHVKYLESRLVEEARRIGKTVLDNGNTPPRPSFSEAAGANVENFLEYILMVLPALRIDSFLANTRPKSPTRSTPLSESPEDVVSIFMLSTPKHSIEATTLLENDEFVVQAGSKVSFQWNGKGTGTTGYARLFAELVKTGVLAQHGNGRVFTDN